MSRKKFTPEYEAILCDATASAVDRANALDCMISDGLRLHESLVVGLLDHESEYLRAASLKAATTWNTGGFFKLLLERLRTDPSEWVRGRAAISAEWVAMSQPKYKEDVLRALAQAVDNDPENVVSSQAYRSFTVIATEKRQRVDSETFDRKRDVDEKLIAPYRKQAASKTSAS